MTMEKVAILSNCMKDFNEKAGKSVKHAKQYLSEKLLVFFFFIGLEMEKFAILKPWVNI